jgi:hypothetical protein
MFIYFGTVKISQFMESAKICIHRQIEKHILYVYIMEYYPAIDVICRKNE